MGRLSTTECTYLPTSDVARSASSPKAVQALRCSLTPGLRVVFGRVPCMARAASVPGLWTLAFLLVCGACVGVWFPRQPCQPWLGSRVRVLGYGFRLRPDTPTWRSWGVCFGLGFAFTPPILAGLLGCVPLYTRSASTPPFQAGVCGACVRARVLDLPHTLWLGCVVSVCACRFRFWPHPANPCSGVGRVCLCACSACTRPFLAGMCSVGVCSPVRVSAAPVHCLRGCWGACVCVRALPVPCQS